ncbi:MAG: hypothetical protein LKH21_09575, partial [Solobacterium sp.]|nr:hypothetical protein [Solobacterium sp.]
CLSKKAAPMIYKSSVRFISRFIRRHQAPTTGFNLMPLSEIADLFYSPDEEAHRMYIGEVMNILEGKK